jgi:hypothetical protein
MKSAGGATGGTAKRVHYSRVIHVAEDLLDDNVEGVPRLRAVLNRLDDLERVAGASSEMFWRGGLPGHQFDVRDGHSLQGQALADLQDEIEKYLHGLQRYVRTKGIDIKGLDSQVADPRGHVDVLIDLVAAATGIPKRILMGSERGELASSMDEETWLALVESRRLNHCEPTILRPFVDLLLAAGALPAPKDGYTIDWPDLRSVSDREAAEVGEVRSKSLKNYVMAPGAEEVVPPTIFLRTVLGLSEDEIVEVETQLKEIGAGANAVEEVEFTEDDEL